MIFNALEKKYNDARERALKDLNEFGLYSKEFKQSLVESFHLLKELRRTHPKSFLLKKTFKPLDWQNNDKK